CQGITSCPRSAGAAIDRTPRADPSWDNLATGSAKPLRKTRAASPGNACPPVLANPVPNTPTRVVTTSGGLMWGIEAADLPAIFLASGTLVLIEGRLSADNAPVLAVMVRHLPDKKQQRRALRYGIWGAFIFRFIAILTASFLLRFWFLKALG